MNKREIAKEKTKAKLLKTARQEFLKKGFLNTSTESICKKASVAHGTLFLHFKNKESLILEIYDMELKKFAGDLYHTFKEISGLELMLEKYLDYLESNEKFFAVLAKEMPFYNEKLRRKIFFREGAIRKYFYSEIESGIKAGIYKELDITTAVNFLFGTITYFLNMKESFATHNVIQEKRQQIYDTFMIFIKK